jgi:hypothetical protein
MPWCSRVCLRPTGCVGFPRLAHRHPVFEESHSPGLSRYLER